MPHKKNKRKEIQKRKQAEKAKSGSGSAKTQGSSPSFEKLSPAALAALSGHLFDDESST